MKSTNRTTKLIAFTLLILPFSMSMVLQSAQASRFDANVGGDSARVGLAITVLEASQGSNLEIGGNYLGSKLGDERVGLYALTAHVIGNAGEGFIKTTAAVGTQFTFADVDEVDGGALSVGGFFIGRFTDLERLGFAGKIYYAPDLLTFGDADKYLEYSLAVEYDLLRETTIYLNYRQVKVGFDFDGFSDDVTVDTGTNIGVRVTF